MGGQRIRHSGQAHSRVLRCRSGSGAQAPQAHLRPHIRALRREDACRSRLECPCPVRDREVDSELIAMLRKRNVSLTATLVRDELLFAYGAAPSWIDDPFFLKFVSPERLTVLKTRIRDEQAKNPQRELIKAGFEMNKINLKKLSDGGVRIALGTDSGGFFIQGYSEHREMELMVQSGLTPMQVIQSFSKGASEALGIDKDFGTLAKGKTADLLVLEKNPLENITNMRSIQTIYLGGKKFE